MKGTNAIFEFLKKSSLVFFLKLRRRLFYFLYFLEKHYTPLAILILIICGSVLFFITSYLSRYSKWDYWRWKSRAIKKTLVFTIILVAIKIILTRF